MLSEVSQEVKDKYHMISPISGTYGILLINKTNKEGNITRFIKIQNKLTVTRGEGEGKTQRKRGRVIKEHV